MKPLKNDKWLDDVISKAISTQTPPFDFDKWKQKYPEEFQTLVSPVEKGTPAPTASEQNIWRIIMKSRITKIAAAAIIIIGVFLGIVFMGGPDMASVSWAEVAQKVEQAQSFMYQIKMTMNGRMMPEMPEIKNKEMEISVIVSAEYGMKMETSSEGKAMQQMYIIPRENAMIMIMPEMKKYIRMEFDEEMLEKMKKQNQDPRYMVEELMKFEYTELGRNTIDGIEVEGIEVTDPRFGGGMFDSMVTQLWVDVEEGLPVRMEMDITQNKGQMKMHMVADNYQWNIDIDPSEFEPIIPNDYTAGPSMKIPKMNEETAIGGLKKFLELTGHYPEKLNLMDMVGEISKIKKEEEKQAEEKPLQIGNEKLVAIEVMPENISPEELKKLMERNRETMEHNKKITEEIMKKAERTMAKAKTTMEKFKDHDFDAEMNKMMTEFMPVQSLGMFYMTLVQEDKDPAYYGDTVGQDDVDAVLLRWKVADDEYRVIFGDLSVETVSADQLAELKN